MNDSNRTLRFARSLREAGWWHIDRQDEAHLPAWARDLCCVGIGVMLSWLFLVLVLGVA